jgi:hypothetical protein
MAGGFWRLRGGDAAIVESEFARAGFDLFLHSLSSPLRARRN